MFPFSPGTRIFVCLDDVDFRKGIDKWFRKDKKQSKKNHGKATDVKVPQPLTQKSSISTIQTTKQGIVALNVSKEDCINYPAGQFFKS